ncbi:lactonase family protein [Acidicapsa ligni]|uniref:lactonase family protein n=1 Tax=Acidicapsa ligni TaxID=542300 RepID=UPI0021DF81CF|nr:lactonase family protein [Acidicapsa ligni]
MSLPTRWSRRAFVQGVGYASAASAVGTLLPASAALSLHQDAPGFAYVGSAAHGGKLLVFSVSGNRWTLQQRVASRVPASLALHPHGRFLYTVNQVDETDGLPRGSVEAYAIASDGRITLLNRQPLALSAVRPRQLAISPDGSSLVVAVHGGGAYNLLSIKKDGALEPVRSRLKETGSGLHPQLQASAHPHTAIFDPTGRFLFATDEGCDRLSAFAIHEGKLARRQQVQTAAGSGPGHAVIHDSGSLFYVANGAANGLQGSIAGYRIDISTGRIEGLLSSVNMPSSSVANGLHLRGNILYAASTDGVSVWQINPQTGGLTQTQQWSDGSPEALATTADGRAMIALDRTRNRVMHAVVAPTSGRLLESSAVAEIDAPISIALRA